MALIRQPDVIPRWAMLGFATSLIIGIVFLFVGIDKSSLWYDELFTLWVITPTDAATMFGRVITDIHPPLYYVTSWLWYHLTGTSTVSLRLFTSLCTAGALLSFVVWMPMQRWARVFGAALAVNSLFIVWISQQARSYALVMWLVTVMMILALRILDAQKPRRTMIAGLIMCVMITSLSHPFGMLTGCSCLTAMVMLRPALWRSLGPAVIGVGLLYGAWQYLVIVPNTQFNLADNWIPKGWVWIGWQSVRAATWVFGAYGTLAVLACALPAARQLAANRGKDRQAAGLLVLVPIMVWLASLLLSIVVAPNMTDRNLLVTAPFFWGLAALLFELAMKQGGQTGRIALMVTALCALLSASVVQSRFRDLRQPYREVNAAILTDRRCTNQDLFSLSFGRPEWTRPGFTAELERFAQGYQLGGGNKATNIFALDIIAGKADAQIAAGIERARKGCPVLAFSVHNTRQPELWSGTISSINRIAARQGVRVVQVEAGRAEELGMADYVLMAPLLGFSHRVASGYLLWVEALPAM